ncbi:VCBS repeat-containing protein [Anaeromicropila herbilytica]|uniref:VCBS repeat-containing protein n=1 Tax=Anaeromicropila herbilytica TaxID=2785025 RepID=A0A7R7EN28_9FIRM|nr:VCBS repeat-containing protein [Anaeromicropila herbilytica]BCN31769.1 hypothetical protein bsdtb5_30640 [Anaeromicropila herbilytica]
MSPQTDEMRIWPTKIVSYSVGDVNGDQILDHVYLIGTSKPDSPFTEDITLIIQDGESGELTMHDLEENAGYNPRIFLGDFTGDGTDDILISIDSGGSGATMYHYIYSFYDSKLQLRFDFNQYNNQYNYDIIYKDNEKVDVFSEYNNTSYVIDISLKDLEYLSEIYNDNGILKTPIEGFVNPLSGMYPVDYDGDNVYELLAYQKIAGRYNADALGYILNTLKWDKDSFELFNQNVAIIGEETVPID